MAAHTPAPKRTKRLRDVMGSRHGMHKRNREQPENLRSEVVSLAKAGRPHGIRGWLRLYPHGGNAALLACAKWLIRFPGNDWQPAAQRVTRITGEALLVKFNGVDERNGAVALRNTEIGLQRCHLPELADDEHYWHDLLGMLVNSAQGHLFGTVRDVFSNGANEVLVVEGNIGGQTLIPFAEPHLLSIDRHRRVLVVDWPEKL